MNRDLGLWIDHKQAFLIWSGKEKVDVIPSNLEPRARPAHGTRIGGTKSQYAESELRINDRYNERLKKFYTNVIEALKTADSILIMGPGEAKQELKKFLEQHKPLRKRLVKVETADKMTMNQMTAYVKEFFTRRARSENKS